MCSLNNAIKLYREEAEAEDKKKYMIFKKIDNINIPLKNKDGDTEYFNSKEEAEIDRIYHQPDYDEVLKVIEVQTLTNFNNMLYLKKGEGNMKLDEQYDHYDFYVENCTENEIPLKFEEWQIEILPELLKRPEYSNKVFKKE